MNGILNTTQVPPASHSQVKAITKWKEVSPLEFFISNYSQDPSCKWDQINRCSICLCELWDEIADSEDIGEQIHKEQKIL